MYHLAPSQSMGGAMQNDYLNDIVNYVNCM